MKKQYFKVGDKVTCPMYGKGEVIGTEGHHYEPITVKFGALLMCYTIDGKCGKDFAKRTLYQGHIDIPEPELKEIVTFEKGEIVWCMDNVKKWHCVKFEEFNKDFPDRIMAYHPQSDPAHCSKCYYDIRKYEDRPF